MPQFSKHTPIASSTIRKKINMEKAISDYKPIGVIGKNSSYAYGYNGRSYYVTEGVFSYLLTTTYLTFDEAKNLFEACTFVGYAPDKPKAITSIVKAARKLKLKEAELMYFFIDQLEL